MAIRKLVSRSGAYLPLYVGDYLRDTQHLSPAEDGVYHRLLMAYWAAGEPLPADDRKLAAVARVPLDDWLGTYKPAMLEFFRPNAKTWHQKRMDCELQLWRELSQHNQAAGRASGRARVQRVFNECSTSVEPPDPDPKKKARDSPPTAELALIGQDRIPYDQIVQLYHQMLPMCPAVKKFTERRRGLLRARWHAGELPDMETWQKYFAYVASSEFLTGRTTPKGDRPPFLADLEWLCREGNYVKVWEGRYHHD